MDSPNMMPFLNKQTLSNYPDSFPSTNPSHPSTIELSDRSGPAGGIPKSNENIEPSIEGFPGSYMQSKGYTGSQKVVTS